MNDDDLPELIMRASAYLDGELDAAEMARAEADPAVMAEVAALRELQAEVRDVEPASDAVREATIAAALAEFDALNAAHVPVPPADDRTHVHRAPGGVVPFRPRPVYARWLTAAAAVLAVGVLGVVAVNGVGGGDDEDGGDLAQVADSAESIETGRTALAEGGSAEESAPALEAAPEAADVMAAAPATTAAAEAFAEETGAPAEDATALATEAPAANLPLFDPDRPIVGIDELAAVGAELVAGEEAGTVARDVETRCDLAPYEPYKRGLYDGGAGAREVVIAIDRGAGRVGAFDEGTCTPLAETPLPDGP